LDPELAEKLNEFGVSTPLIEETTDSDQFAEAIKSAKASNKFGAQVSVLTPEQYADSRLFMTPDGMAGFAILDGELVSLFNHRDSPYRGVSASMVMLGVQEGGLRLQGFDTYLPKIYRRLGFTESQRYPWDEELKVDDWDYDTYRAWNNGRPDFLEMEYKTGLGAGTAGIVN
jgi:hypothetical protein